MRVVNLRSTSEQTSGMLSAAIAPPNAKKMLACAQSRNAAVRSRRPRRLGRVCGLTAVVSSSNGAPMRAAPTSSGQLRILGILSMYASQFGLRHGDLLLLARYELSTKPRVVVEERCSGALGGGCVARVRPPR